jgi:hypothetical protein
MNGWMEGRKGIHTIPKKSDAKKNTHTHTHTYPRPFEYVKLSNERQEHEIMHAKQQRQKLQ